MKTLFKTDYHGRLFLKRIVAILFILDECSRNYHVAIRPHPIWFPIQRYFFFQAIHVIKKRIHDNHDNFYVFPVLAIINLNPHISI